MIPIYLQKYDPVILNDLRVESIDVNKGTFKYRIIFYDPTDDIHERDEETGLVKKTAHGEGTFSWLEPLSADKAQTEDDMYPEIENISFGELAVSDEILSYVYDEIYGAISKNS